MYLANHLRAFDDWKDAVGVGQEHLGYVDYVVVGINADDVARHLIGNGASPFLIVAGV